VEIAAGVGVELRQIYLPRRCSHHPNNAPQQTSPNPNYIMEERDPPPSCRQSGKRRERGPTPTLEIWGFGNCVTAARCWRRERRKRFGAILITLELNLSTYIKKDNNGVKMDKIFPCNYDFRKTCNFFFVY
jgi:hypothetical protein